RSIGLEAQARVRPDAGATPGSHQRGDPGAPGTTDRFRRVSDRHQGTGRGPRVRVGPGSRPRRGRPRPPVCRVMDYSKYKYEPEQKAKLARKHQSTITIKEIKLRPKVGQHDYET